ncbi:hypothetical protein KO508_10265 [Marinobacter salexigens]|uniref:Esterase n=2 Tax=Marinobacter salexigens TaxID=1925763 RepID=A0ABS6AB24_9GAMM|nr:hypothetical protein [Marinobacter salexigens]
MCFADLWPGMSRRMVLFFVALMVFSMLPAASYGAVPDEVTLPGAQAFMLESPETGRDYLIQVSVPDAPPPDTGYPVLYLLDGNAYLPLMQVARDTVTRESPSEAGNPLLIVAIGYPDADRFAFEQRAADYTPPGAARNRAEGQHGGATRFLAFINTRLKPEIARRFQVDPDKEALFGHSFGGLFVTHVLMTAPESFERYIAISPSLWWYGDDPLRALSEYDLAVDTEVGVAPRLLIGVGSLEQTPGESERGTPKAEVRRSRAMVDNVGLMAEWLDSLHPDWDIQAKSFPGENHGSVMWPAARRAVEFLQQDSNVVRGQ